MSRESHHAYIINTHTLIQIHSFIKYQIIFSKLFCCLFATFSVNKAKTKKKTKEKIKHLINDWNWISMCVNYVDMMTPPRNNKNLFQQISTKNLASQIKTKEIGNIYNKWKMLFFHLIHVHLWIKYNEFQKILHEGWVMRFE